MKNPFTGIFSKLSLFKGNDKGSVVGIDIGSSAIKVIEIRNKNGKAILETYGSISLGPYASLEVGRPTNLPIDKIVEALKEVLKQAGITTTSVAFAIPVQSSLIFSIELPVAVAEKDMTSVISTEARKYIPIPITEVSLDYFILPKKELSYEETNNPDLPITPAKTEVLVIALQNDSIAKYNSIVTNGALEASFFEIEIFSAVRANFEHELSLVLLMDFGASYTKLSLVEFGIVKSYHTVNRGGADISDSIARSLSVSFTQAEEMKKEFGLLDNPTEKNVANIIKLHLDYIFSETNNVLLGHERKYSRAISKVIISGGGSLLKGLKEAAANNFRAEVQMGHPFSKVSTPAFLGKVLDAVGPEFSVSLGIALRKLQ
ncbi:MAG: type IV pilus assembly protein PilM [bacterium]|nr:type IV pilus assembly protein PilM [bacterium]